MRRIIIFSNYGTQPDAAEWQGFSGVLMHFNHLKSIEQLLYTDRRFAKSNVLIRICDTLINL